VVYDVFRNETGCNAGFTKVANDVSGTSYADNVVANNFTYYYQVTAQPSGNEACAAVPSTCLSVTPVSAPCTPPAAPTGVVATATGQTTATVTWTASAGATGYNILRSTTSGGPYTQVGTSATTTFADTGLTCNTTYFYVVQATNAPSCASANSAQASTTTSACSACTVTTRYTNGFETGTGLTDWVKGTFLAGGSTTSWRGIQTCTAQTGSKVFRYGGTTCTADYGSNNFTFAQPSGSAGIAIPAGSTTTRLSFGHRRGFESGFDGGTLLVSVDGTNYTFVPAAAILTNGYNDTVDPACPPAGTAGAGFWTGTSASFTTTTVDLDAACNAATGTSTGCAGRSVRIAFTSITDCSVTGDGWFLDNVTVTACTP
jgi:cellulose 1,4-beta-cellobiosidase